MILAAGEINNPLQADLAMLGAALGVVGTALGIFNTWRSFRKDRVRLRVKPQAVQQYLPMATRGGIPTPNGPLQMGIEVVNIGHLPVVVSSVGLLTSKKDKRASAHAYRTNLGKNLPITLEPRRAVTVILDGAYDDLADHPVHYIGAYAKTECGLEFRRHPHGFAKSIRKKPAVTGEGMSRDTI